MTPFEKTPFEKQLKQEFDKLEKDYDGLSEVMERMACEHATNADEMIETGLKKNDCIKK